MTDNLSALILSRNANDFEAMINHRFVRDIEFGRLSKEDLDRYLLIEGAFVETAIAIFGHAVVKTDNLAIRRKLIRSLDALANEQMPYFEKTIKGRMISNDPLLLNDPRVVGFRDGMLNLARDGSFAQIITCMFAAEWMYWTWCDRVKGVTFEDSTLKEWVLLHAAPDFAQQAKWLRDQVDSIALGLTSVEREDLINTFGHVMRLEIAFHDAAYL